MPKKSVCLKISKTDGEKTLALASRLHLTDKSMEIQRNADALYVPIVRKPDETEITLLKEQVSDLQVTAHIFLEKERQAKNLAEMLEGKLPPHLLASLPKALDVVGDIAILEIPAELEAHKKEIGAAILATHKGVLTVLAKAGAVTGTYRLRSLDFIAGEHRTTTVHKEYGCSFYVDVAKAYFSPRLSHEHWRVASLVQNGETVLDLFAGVGPFAVLIAKKHRDARVYAVDLNVDAVKLLEKNVRLNRVENRVHPIQGDARQVVDEKLTGVADRVIMNLPEKADEFIDCACKAVKPSGGTVHFYGFFKAPDTLEIFERSFADAVDKAGRKVRAFSCTKTVRATAPYEWQAVLDAEIAQD
jgi:tRNA (guanine37-N1)-methyltransferase